MSQFVVSARKYRPQNFDEVVGQQQVTATLKRAIETDHLAQAFLFCGPRGVGKTTTARILAKAVNSGRTENIHEIEEDFAFNIFELDAASNNGVDDIRFLNEQVRVPPQTGKYKIYIIDEVHMLSQQAFNAFLKTLEEPPPYAIFILATTEKHKIIPTILSRCQIFDFKRIAVGDMVSHLQAIAGKEDVKATEEALHIIAEKADGALRDALSIFDRLVSFSGEELSYNQVITHLNVLDYDYFFRITEALLSQDIKACYLLFDEVLTAGFEGSQFIIGLAQHIRNLLMCKDPDTLRLLEVSDALRNRYQEKSSLAPTPLLVNMLSLLAECDVRYQQAQNKRLLVETTLTKMCFLQQMVSGEWAMQKASEKKKPEPQVEEKTPVEPAQQKKDNTVPEPEGAEEKIDSKKKEDNEESAKESNKKDSTVLSSSGLSIDSLRKEVIKGKEHLAHKNKVEESQKNHKKAEDGDSVINAWSTFGAFLREQDEEGLAQIVEDVETSWRESCLHILFDSSIEKDLFTTGQHLFKTYYSKEIGAVPDWHGEVREGGTKKKLYKKPKDIFNDLAKSKPELKKLKDGLGLDFDY